MDDKPFIAWNFIDLGNTGAKEKDPDCEDQSNVSLELSLSLDTVSTATTTTTDHKGNQEIYYEEKFDVGESNYSNDQNKRKEEVRTMKCMEKISSGAFSLESSEADADADISLGLSLSQENIWVSKTKSPATDEGNKRRRLEVGDCSSQHQSQERRHNLINNRLKPPKTNEGLRMENPKVSSNRNKRNKVDHTEAVMTELTLGHDPWCIKKQLFESDLGNMSRLILASELVESHVFPHWNADQLAKIKPGLPVSVWDCDTNTEHDLVFKQWSNGANVLIKNWVKEFVKRRELKVGDEIGLFWDIDSSRFKFAVLNRAPRH